MYSTTKSVLAIIGGIIVIAISDSLSDAWEMHMADESDTKISEKKVWESTYATFFSKFIFTFTFIIPFLLFEVLNAIIICVLWGILLISLFSIYISKQRKIPYYKVVLEHVTIAGIVIIAAYYAGVLIRIFLN